MDVQKLLKALDDDSNETLLNFTTDKIREMNLNIIKELQLSRKDTLEIMNKLNEYKYVDEMNELKYGAYIRWIPIEDPKNIYLTKGALFCEMKITDDGVFCVCKNYLRKNLLTQTIIIKPKFLVVNYIKHNSFFNKIIGYNNLNK